MYINFKSLQDKDLELLFKWSNNDHVKAWYKMPKDFKDFCKKYDPDQMFMYGIWGYIVYFEKTPIGYVQYYQVEKSNEWVTVFGRPNKRVYGIDLFIGELDFLGKGHGVIIVKKIVDKIFNDTNADAVMADPNAENLAAVSCFQNAGLKKVKRVMHDDKYILYMEIDRLDKQKKKSF